MLATPLSRTRQPLGLPLLAGVALAIAPVSAAAGAVYYIGPFSASTPSDDPTCGTGTGAAPAPHPCATLAYWNKNHRGVVRSGDAVRLAPGLYRDPLATGYHCIILDRLAQGVTYEGRTAADGVLQDHESVTVDLTGAPLTGFTDTNPCQGVGISARSGCSDNYGGVIVRDLKIQNAPRTGLELCGQAAAPPTGITLDHVRITACQGGGMVGRFNNDYNPADVDCAAGGRTVKGLTVVDSEFDHNTAFPGGLSLDCMDTADIERSYFHDNCGVGDCTQCWANATMAGCDSFNGINMAGAINVTIRDCEVAYNGESGIDIGGHPHGKSHNVLVERTLAHHAAKNNFNIAGGRYVTVRDSFSWGHGSGIGGYACPHHITVENNTFYNDDDAVQLWYYWSSSSFINNIFGSTNPRTTIFVDYASTNTSNVWENNVVWNAAGGNAIAENPGQEATIKDCMGNNHTVANFDCSNSFQPPPLPCNITPQPVSTRPATAAGLAAFQTDGANGLWFGANTGLHDRWGAVPAFVNLANPSAIALHLLPTDSVAHDGGQPITPPFPDFDGTPRPAGAAWDIGAIEIKSNVPAAPTLLSVDVAP